MSFKKTILKECIASGKTDNGGYSYDTIKDMADHILAASKHRPKVAIICGSGLGGIADKLVNSEVLPYESIPNFPATSVVGHAGRLVLGILAGIPVVCFQGRIHYYEGHPLWKCAICARVIKLMGINDLIVTNAAGGLNPNYKIGDIMVLKDHLNTMNLGGCSPLQEINDSRFGPQYFLMNNAYDKKLRQKAKKIGAEGGMGDIVREGVYTMTTGPMFETPSELKALKILGVDAVGMSTIPEVIMARQCGVRVFAFSLITNICNTDEDSEDADHIDVAKVGSHREKEVTELVTQMVVEMTNQSSSSS